MTEAGWHKSSYSNTGSQCVEVRESQHGAEVRDTQYREHTTLDFPRTEWSALLRAAR